MFDILTYQYKNSMYDTENKFYSNAYYDLRDEAKRAGAQFDGTLKKWYFTTAQARHDWDSTHGATGTPIEVDRTHTLAVIIGTRRVEEKFKTVEHVETDLAGLSAILVDLVTFQPLKKAYYVLPGPKNIYSNITKFCIACTIEEAIADIKAVVKNFSAKIYTYGENLRYLFGDDESIQTFDVKPVLTNVKYNKLLTNKRLNSKGIRDKNNSVEDILELVCDDTMSHDLKFGSELDLIKIMKCVNITPNVYNMYMSSNIPPVRVTSEMTINQAKELMYNVIQTLSESTPNRMLFNIYNEDDPYYDFRTFDRFGSYLEDKYGNVPCDYCTQDYSHVNSEKNSRSNEGLEIHHIFEHTYAGLSDMKICKENNYLFYYQKAKFLVYCNKLEHLIMHILIARESKSVDVYKNGVRRIISHINDNFEFMNNPPIWDVQSSQVIWNKFDVYIALLVYVQQLMLELDATDWDIDSVIFSSIRCKPLHIRKAFYEYVKLLQSKGEESTFELYNPFV